MHLTEMITLWAKDIINYLGYFGAAILMALESMIAPIPSEAVMPPIGALVREGKMVWWIAMLVTSAGSLAGSLISYWLGYVGGKPLVMKVGRYLLVNEHHLDVTVKWFHRHGGATVFVSRFVPVVRHLISVPAGIGKMPLLPFMLYTVVGATLWNGLLMYAGYQWQEHIKEIEGYYKMLDKGVVVLGVVGIGLWIYLHVRKSPAKNDVKDNVKV